jgi:hypothetical protein
MPFIVTMPDGRVAVIRINGKDPGRIKLAKTLFELGRGESDARVHFNPEFHTLGWIAAGVHGHAGLTYRECDESDIPLDREFRNAWVDDATRGVVVDQAKADAIAAERIRLGG